MSAQGRHVGRWSATRVHAASSLALRHRRAQLLARLFAAWLRGALGPFVGFFSPVLGHLDLFFGNLRRTAMCSAFSASVSKLFR